MPLPKPSLDNRSFDQLVSECRGLLMRSAADWTDHNASDAGITLLELGAWLGEQNIYRLDRLSDEARRAFVRLVGVEPRPASVAQTVVAIHGPGGASIALPPRIQLGHPQEAQFETTAALVVSPARLLQFGPEAPDAMGHDDPGRPGEAFFAFGAHPRPDHALHLGFDRALDAPGATLALHVWTEHWQDDAATRHALEADATAWCMRCGDAHAALPADWRQHYRVRTVWEYFAASGSWRPLADVVDETRALTLSGFVRFTAPADQRPSGPDARYRLRCRIASGRFECPPRLVHVAFNAVTCEHALSRVRRVLGRARGHAGAVFGVGEAPIVAGSMCLSLEGSAGQQQGDWREVADWDRSGPHDRDYRLDAQRGEVHSGDGLRGEILPAGHELRADYRRGGGIEGNVGKGSLTQVPLTADNLARAPALAALGAALEVMQPFAASGGAACEPLERAQARAFDLAGAVDKAVTLADIERLARATPGVPVARARAVANMDPLLPCFAAPGVITLLVIPPCPRAAPRPSQAMLDAVARYLEPRRLVTGEIRLAAARYRKVGVQARLSLVCGADAAQVGQRARARLDAYFDPLSGGTDGLGWPFGGAVYRSEVLALLAGTKGVDRVTELGFVVGPAAGQASICDNVLLCANELVRPGRHRLTISSDIAIDLNRSDPHECEPR
ncbi:putative baseplate assembly protein [Variovorax sp. YR752]|uniref:putative baseplate assembly protein n=1 Tax=Variovorax sp. YR752 TaxID=1884383 RepID=UPI003137E0F0